MNLKKFFVLLVATAVISVILMKSNSSFSESEDTQKSTNEKLSTIITKQDEIIKELAEIKKEINIVKIRVSSR
jgi:peptidoglycan hydrolase CwlO-like protein